VSHRTLAISIATLAHKGQKRRGGEDYIVHPRRVAERVERAGLGDLAIQVAWLHDVIEDSDVTATELLDRGCWPDVVRDVQALSRGRDQTYGEFIANIKYGASDRARHVKVHDLLDNLTDDPAPWQIRRYSRALSELTFDYRD
jgi:(p)ppGpp synthase/HD superfamily hydrolase